MSDVALCSFCQVRPIKHWRRATIFGVADFCTECQLAYEEQLEKALYEVNSKSSSKPNCS